MTEAVAPSFPHWVVLEREAGMRVEKRILGSVVFLGSQTGDGFRAEGAAFFLHLTVEEMSFVYLVSCRHVVKPFGDRLNEIPNDLSISIRIDRKRAMPKIYEAKRSEWVCHRDRFIDVCVYEPPIRKWEAEDNVDASMLSVDSDLFVPEKEREYGRLSVGDPLFIPGIFTGRVGKRRSIQVFRTTSIAALAEKPIDWGSPYRSSLSVETSTLDVPSGSPVFVRLSEVGRRIGADAEGSDARGNRKTGEADRPYYLIGMMQGTDSGVSVVLPYSLILEVLNQPALNERRISAIEESKKRSGYRPAQVPAVKDARSEISRR